MLVIIDESGDTGFKDSSSRYFVMTMTSMEMRPSNPKSYNGRLN